MLRTLKNLFKQDREKFVVPKSVQNVIPIKTIWDDGIFLVGRNKYAKTFKFEDINYAVASREDKEAMFLEYSELLNSLDSGATTKITINNRRLNKADFEQTILIPMADDGLDKYRKEYNKMLLDKATGANSIVQDKYVTVSVCKKNIEEARNYFARVGADLIAHFNGPGKDSDKSFLLLTIKIRCQDIYGLCQIRMTFRKILGLHGPDPCRDLSGKRSSAITSYPFYPTVAMPHPIERHMPYRRPRISQTKDDRNEDRQDHRGIV